MTQSDPGTENTCIANAQCTMRQLLNPQLLKTLQHNWKQKKTNMKAEIEWSQFRKQSALRFDDILEQGIASSLRLWDKHIKNL
ncbi:hypothetical protein NMY22_g18151 [Coprinellus aureogranulatus]|nr:hypothetical protein NMY22_g18151 [Coprinellus aureogranulatus]